MLHQKVMLTKRVALVSTRSCSYFMWLCGARTATVPVGWQLYSTGPGRRLTVVVCSSSRSRSTIPQKHEKKYVCFVLKDCAQAKHEIEDLPDLLSKNIGFSRVLALSYLHTKCHHFATVESPCTTPCLFIRIAHKVSFPVCVSSTSCFFHYLNTVSNWGAESSVFVSWRIF